MSVAVEDILLANLKKLEKDRMRLNVLTRYELSLLAARVAHDIRHAEVSDLTELLHAMRDVDFLREARTQGAGDGRLTNEEAVCRMGAMFSELLATELADIVLSGETSDNAEIAARIACVRAPATEALFSSAPLRDCVREIVSAVNAEDACLAVVERRADCALLPLSYENGERILGIEGLAERYDLYLTSVLQRKREGKSLSFGLFSLYNRNRFVGESCFLEARIYGDSFASCASIVSACSELGFFAEDMRCGRDEYDRYAARVIFRTEGNEFALRIYLSMLSAGYAELGNYSILTLKEEEIV